MGANGGHGSAAPCAFVPGVPGSCRAVPVLGGVQSNPVLLVISPKLLQRALEKFWMIFFFFFIIKMSCKGQT